MKNSKTLFQDFVTAIKLKESRDEIHSITHLVFQHVFGLSKTDILAGKEINAEPSMPRLLEIITRVNDHEPVQYILEEALFYGRIFHVNKAVLIPRPETEELVALAIDFLRTTDRKDTRIWDIGTGSGCIPITLALEFPEVHVLATDVSKEALRVAIENAGRLEAAVEFRLHDILHDPPPGSFDLIVSNPPYIELREKNSMSRNVVAYEPEIALFVNSDDVLLFYRAIVRHAVMSLRKNGLLAVEINERFGQEVLSLFVDNNFQDVQLLQDVFGKNRIVKGRLSS